MLFVFLQTPCPNSHCSTCCIQLGWGGSENCCRLQLRVPPAPGSQFWVHLSPRLFYCWLPWRHVLWAVSQPSVLPRTSGRLVLIAGLLSHILEALTRCLGQVAGLHAAAGCLPWPELAIGTLSPGRNACDVICPALRLCSRVTLGVRLPVGNISGE